MYKIKNTGLLGHFPQGITGFQIRKPRAPCHLYGDLIRILAFML